MRFASLIPVLFFLQSHAQLQTYSLKGELALSGLTSSDVPDDLSSYQSNFLYLPKLSILKQLTSNQVIDSELSLRWMRNYSGDSLLLHEQEFYRYWLRYYNENFEARFGLQKIVFGTSQFLRTLSWFDSIDPMDPIGQTSGVKALRLRWFPMHNLSSWNWIIASKDDTLSYGGRIEFSNTIGEWGFTYHTDPSKSIKSISSINTSVLGSDSRFAIDYRFDGLIGLWNESALIQSNRSKVVTMTLGADYTLPISTGLLLTVEYMSLQNQFDYATRDSKFLALMASIPLGITHQIMMVSQMNIGEEKLYHFLRWSSTYNYYSLNFICTIYPNRSSYQHHDQFLHQSLAGFGTGLQVMFIYNH